MKTKEVSGTMENAYGEKLATKIDYKGLAEVYETPAEVKEKGDWPKDSDIVGFVNDRIIASKRQEFMKAALDAAGIKKPTLEDPKVQFSQIVKALQAAGKDEATAKQLANASLGTSF